MELMVLFSGFHTWSSIEHILWPGMVLLAKRFYRGFNAFLSCIFACSIGYSLRS